MVDQILSDEQVHYLDGVEPEVDESRVGLDSLDGHLRPFRNEFANGVGSAFVLSQWKLDLRDRLSARAHCTCNVAH